MRKFIKTTINVLFVLVFITSCNKEEITKEIEKPQNGEIAVSVEITVDGVNVTNTRAATEAGYTTGDGLYNRDDMVTVAAFANDGYELMAFYDKGGKVDQQNADSYTFPARIPQTFKAEFAKKTRFIVGGYRSYIGEFGSMKQTQPSDCSWESITYANGKVVAVGTIQGGTSKGCIGISYDGATWNTKISDIRTKEWNDVTYANGKFIVVGRGWDWASFSSSVDGVNWTPSTDIPSLSWGGGVAYGNGLFVIVGASGSIATSTNGENWSVTKIADRHFTDIIYDNGLFIATGLRQLASSPDGINWTKIDIGTNSWEGVAYGKGQFVAVGIGGYTTTSKDGINWTQVNRVANSQSLHSIVYSNGKFVAVQASSSYDDKGYLISSKDGINWDYSIPSTSKGLFSICVVPYSMK